MPLHLDPLMVSDRPMTVKLRVNSAGNWAPGAEWALALSESDTLLKIARNDLQPGESVLRPRLRRP